MQNVPFLRAGLTVFVILFIIFLYAPMAVMAILSFQAGPNGGPQFPIIEWSTYWYSHLLGYAQNSRINQLNVFEPLIRSLGLACMTMVTSTVLGVVTAQAVRSKVRGSGVVFYLVILGMIVPGLLVGLGIALMANALGLPRAWWGTSFVAHVVYTFPFAFLVMLAMFNRFDRTVEQAAWSLGVSPATTFRKITLPLIFPGVLSSMLFAFTLSYDEFARTLFTSGGQLTLPLTIYGTFSLDIYPNLFAFGVLTTLFSFSLLAIYGLLMSLNAVRARRFALQEET